MAGEAKLGSTSRALARGLGGAGPAAMEGGRPVPGLALEVAHADLDASTQRMESVEPCRLGLWAIGELENEGGGRFLCFVHPVGVHITLASLSGGSFRCRAEQQADTLFFKDGSSKKASAANSKNVSAGRCGALLRQVDPEGDPEGTFELREGVAYTYGDHWSLSVEGGVLSCRNDHKELMMRTTFDGRPVTTASKRYPEDSSPCLRLDQSSCVRFTDAWHVEHEVFRTPERTLALTISSEDAALSEANGRTLTVRASYAAELLRNLQQELGLSVALKLMYPDPDFGELCLMTSLSELTDECNVTLKAVTVVDPSQVSEAERAQLEEYCGFLRNVPLFEALDDTEVEQVAVRPSAPSGPFLSPCARPIRRDAQHFFVDRADG